MTTYRINHPWLSVQTSSKSVAVTNLPSVVATSEKQQSSKASAERALQNPEKGVEFNQDVKQAIKTQP